MEWVHTFSVLRVCSLFVQVWLDEVLLFLSQSFLEADWVFESRRDSLFFFSVLELQQQPGPQRAFSLSLFVALLASLLSEKSVEDLSKVSGSCFASAPLPFSLDVFQTSLRGVSRFSSLLFGSCFVFFHAHSENPVLCSSGDDCGDGGGNGSNVSWTFIMKRNVIPFSLVVMWSH